VQELKKKQWRIHCPTCSCANSQANNEHKKVKKMKKVITKNLYYFKKSRKCHIWCSNQKRGTNQLPKNPPIITGITIKNIIIKACAVTTTLYK
jgi:hypothetical protein